MSACTPSELPDMHCKKIIEQGKMTLHWFRTETAIKFTAEHPYPGRYGAVGWPVSGGNMVPGTAVFGWDNGVMKQYSLNGYSSADVVEATLDWELADISTETVDGVVYLRFTRALDGTFTGEGSIKMLAAVGTGGPDATINYHNWRQAFDFVAGDVAPTPAPTAPTSAPLNPTAAPTPGPTAAPAPTPVPTPAPTGAPTEAGAGCAASELEGFACQLEVRAGLLTLHWAEQGSGVLFGLQGPTEGYLGLGWSDNGRMVGSHAVIGTPEHENAPSVQAWKMNSKSFSSFDESSEVAVEQASVEGSPDSGVLVKFVRPYSAAWDGSGEQKMIYAIGFSDRLSSHRASGTLTLDLLSGQGEASAILVKSDEYSAHGALMTAGWAVLIPLGMMVARYMERPPPGGGRMWLNVHMGSQVLGLTLALAAWILAMVEFETPAGEAHRTVGILVMVLGCIQPLNGMVRPKPGAQYRWQWELLHKNTGRVAAVLALANCFLGLDRTFELVPNIAEGSGGKDLRYILLIAWVCVLGLSAVALEYRKYSSAAAARADPAPQGTEMKPKGDSAALSQA